MKASRTQIAADIRRLFATLEPYGIRRPSQLAVLLRDKNSADPTWPSDAYIRLMLADKGPEPSERFCSRFYALASHVYESLSGDGEYIAVYVADALPPADTFDPTAIVRWVTVPSNMDIHPATLDYKPGSHVALALIPEAMLGHCEDDECGRPFIRRVPWQRYCCAAHGRAWRRRQATTDAVVSGGTLRRSA